ncbi:RagB/SusD family nutrient uptake outer membrane protein, partial [Capnocytophaga sp.]
MKTNYKLYTLVGLLGLSFTACELKEDLSSVYNKDNAYTTEENAQEGVNGIYRYLLGATHASTFYINDMSTDDCFKDGIAFEIFNENGLSGNVELARCYNGNWQMIGCANTAIDNISMIPESRFKTADKKVELLAEAHFMRAFAFYQLTNAFYRVPLITNGFYNANANPTLATVEELDDQIEQDLLIATNNLPDEWGTVAEGGSSRPTKGAAYGYLMRLNMRKAGRLREEGKDPSAAWQAALVYADQVIGSGKYTLQTKVFDVFD